MKSSVLTRAEMSILSFFSFLRFSRKSWLQCLVKVTPELKPMSFSIEWYHQKLNSVGPTPETTAGNGCVLKLLGAGWPWCLESNDTLSLFNNFSRNVPIEL